MGKKKLVSIIIFIFIFLGCGMPKLKLEEKTTNLSKESPKVRIKRGDSFFKLEPKFQGGRPNPFMPVTGGGYQTTAATLPSQLPSSSPNQSPLPIPNQLSPLPDQQKAEEKAVAVPMWPTESPILTAGPSQLLSDRLLLRVRGIIYSGKGNSLAIIQELNRDLAKTDQPYYMYKSYIVKEGSVFSDFGLKVKEITKDYVIVKKGNQSIVLDFKSVIGEFSHRVPGDNIMGRFGEGGKGSSSRYYMSPSEGK